MNELAAATYLARAAIRRHSKSFAMASRLLPRSIAADAEILYAWCRKADDAVDLEPAVDPSAALRALEAEVGAMYSEQSTADPIVAAMRGLVSRCNIPRAYLDEFLLGMQMDASSTVYQSFADLLLYCHRVAGTVGLMMCHVMGVRERRALVHAAHLGIAMQLTNIARDVLEDWKRGRLYLPAHMLARAGAGGLRARLGRPFPSEAVSATRVVVAELLDRAEDYYRSGDAGLAHLSPRCAFAVRTARLVYSRIGVRLRRDKCHPFAARATVPTHRKLALVARAALETSLRAPTSMLRPRPRVPAPSFDPRLPALRDLEAPSP